MNIASPAPFANKLLAALPQQDFDLLRSHLTVVSSPQGTVLFDVDEEIEQVFFPLKGMVSLLVILKNGDAIETATVGREGVVGAMAGWGLHRSHVRAVMQLTGFCARIPAIEFRKATSSSRALSALCVRYNETLLDQARLTAACNISHAAEARLCRWLLQSRDRAESDTLPLTQEFLGEMLGLQRTSVNAVAGKMQEAGVIRYSHGIIKIIDPSRLLEMSCECYETLREQSGSGDVSRVLMPP